MKKIIYSFKLNILGLALCFTILNVKYSANAQMSAQFADTLEQTLINFATTTNMQGVASAVVFPDGSTWSSTYGNSGTAALNTDMLFDIGSNTKSMISTIMLMLEEDGLLSIDDTLYQYINVVEHVPYGITLKQLLKQRSGIANYTSHANFTDSVILNNTSTFWHPDSLLAHFLEAPLFAPGQFWGYSNTNYLLLGKVIESVEGLPLNTVLYNRLFSPFNLTNSFLEAYDTYPLVKTGAYLGPGNYWSPNMFYAMMSSTWAAGGVVATPDDFASYCHQLFRGDILSPTAFAKMKAGTNFGGGNIYGLGIERIRYNNRYYYMHGGTTLQNSEMHYSLESDFSVTVMNLDQGFYNQTVALQHALIDLLEYAVHHVLTIPEQEELLSINAYPNPSNDQISIDLPHELKFKKVRFELYNTLGKVIDQGVFDSDMLILDKKSIGSGLFFVRLLEGDKVVGEEKVVFY